MELLLPPGQMTMIDNARQGLILTNAVCERVRVQRNPKVVELVALNDTWDVPMDFSKVDLAHIGIYDHTTMSNLLEGKFVYLNDGTFFLTSTVVEHRELPGMVGNSTVTAVGAGFFRMSPHKLKLSGRSDSLGGVRPRFDSLDHKNMAAHMGLIRQKAPAIDPALDLT